MEKIKEGLKGDFFVVIKENQKIKEGRREFNKFFNKYSINDYDKILNE